MWHACNPKSDDDLKQCAELGKSLSRMSQPTILIVLAESAEPLHGYVIVQKAAASPCSAARSRIRRASTAR